MVNVSNSDSGDGDVILFRVLQIFCEKLPGKRLTLDIYFVIKLLMLATNVQIYYISEAVNETEATFWINNK